MEEGGTVKAAPVTRLRRRLSVESDDTKSPSAPSTPTKKRNTRLAAKPQLELIDEHGVTNSPKRSARKSITRDIVESEEKPMTPARRSARTKSNTSLVSEAEEKSMTPARRSTRIKSNSSIVSEAALNVETPRAKRAIARRNSLAGSDTETTLTPARTKRTRKSSTSSTDKEGTPSVSDAVVTPGRTRRTRKDSNSSIDIPDEASQAQKPSLITEVIVEEPEAKLKKTTDDNDNIDNNDSPTRKSPRLAKITRKSQAFNTNEVPTSPQESGEQNDNESTSTVKSSHDRKSITVVSESDISVSSANLINNLDTKLRKKASNKNKSLSDIEDTLESTKRNRTKSWATLGSSSPSVERTFLSDNESVKRKLKKHGKMYSEKRLSETVSGDGPNSTVSDKITDDVKELSKQTRKSRDSSIPDKYENTHKSVSEAPKEINISNESNKENLFGVAPVRKDTSTAELLFENTPSGDVKSMVIIEDSDSNTGSAEKPDIQTDGDDQCVPVVQHQTVNHITSPENSANTDECNIFALIDKNKVDDSSEPMDIDETLPENISLTALTEEVKQSRQSLLCIAQQTDDDDKLTPNKSRRKTSMSQSISVHEQSNFKDESMVSQHNRKSSLSVTHEGDSSKSANKSKRKSSISHFVSENGTKPENDIDYSEANLNMFTNESIPDKKSHKASLAREENLIIFEQKFSSSSNLYQDNNKVEDNGNNITNEQMANPQMLTFVTQDHNNITEETKRSKKKSLSNSISSELDTNENKSTLVLSQIKDTSASENNVSKSPQNISEMSSSVNIVESTKNAVNKVVDDNYLTSTPVQQKNIEKLAIQMNTSVITPTNENKKYNKVIKNAPKENDTIVSKRSAYNSSEENSEESVEDEDSSRDESNLFDNQAEDVGEDYESGDSQEQDERQYEEENEVIDKGETLTSEDEISDDSDYEKDSFLVSSDEEDNDLLSGSGDDLGLSDNELTLSVKSKKKYNDRKLKEQKKASREMFEARHGVQECDIGKYDIKNRSRLDSTLLKSEEDMMPPKKNKRMRLESTLDSSQDKSYSEDVKPRNDSSTLSDNNEIIGYKKKKCKRLSESVCYESTINENEITFDNKRISKKEDPLSIQIKTEPKTPQKGFEISSVHITDDIEQIRVDENTSILNMNETTDPLQATMIQEEHDSHNDDSISENEEIANNYDALLKELHNKSKRQIKSHVISLNLNKKVKHQRKEAIVDKLNLTQTKISKKDISLKAKEKTIKRVFKKMADTEDASSDSIDLQLLFSDESNDSNKRSDKQIESEEGAETIIPLKKAKAQTDVRSGLDEGIMDFFIDTKGDLPGNTEESDSDDAPVEMLYVSEKRKKSTLTKTPTSEKIKTNLLETQEAHAAEACTSAPKTPVSEKINKKLQSQGIPIHVPKTPGSDRKKKLKAFNENKTEVLESHEIIVTEKKTDPTDIVPSGKDEVINKMKRKRKTSANKTNDDGTIASSEYFNDSVLGNKKKKIKISCSTDVNETHTNILITEAQEPENEKTCLNNTKKKKHIYNTRATNTESELQTEVRKKRKERDEDLKGKKSKVFKEHIFDKVHVPRLPPSLIYELDSISKKEVKKTDKKACVVSTSTFNVEETQKRKNKPSDFLEENVYLNNKDSETIVTKKTKLERPKVLPFLPTVSTSDSGFTTNFHVNVISSQETKFVAQSNAAPNFKNDYLNEKKIKKLRTYELYKKQRNIKLSKY